MRWTRLACASWSVSTSPSRRCGRRSSASSGKPSRARCPSSPETLSKQSCSPSHGPSETARPCPRACEPACPCWRCWCWERRRSTASPPRSATANASRLRRRHWPTMGSPEIHPTATVAETAEVGEDTRVWHHCHVMAGARIGARCVLGHAVFVGPHVVLGDGCRIQNHVSLFDGVALEDDVFVGPSATFTHVNTPPAFGSMKHKLGDTQGEHR